MLWKLILSLLAFFGGRRHPHLDIIEPVGPVSEADIAEAHRAIHGHGGDMLFDEDRPDAGIKDTRLRWPGYPGKGVVPYVIHSSVAQHRDLILRAMEQYHKLTCIQFVPRKSETNYINIVNGRGCSSYVGMVNYRGGQPVTLGRGCEYIGTVVHELGHAIGLYHEHQRSDRDTYVTIYKNNVTSGQFHNFDRTESSKELIFTSYDYSSIMHYGNYAFSKQPGRLMTMVAKTGQKLLEPFDKPGFTNNDIDMIKKLYKC